MFVLNVLLKLEDMVTHLVTEIRRHGVIMTPLITETGRYGDTSCY
jgi:hypothetical protein